MRIKNAPIASSELGMLTLASRSPLKFAIGIANSSVRSSVVMRIMIMIIAIDIMYIVTLSTVLQLGDQLQLQAAAVDVD
jgi:hypothetical protein